MPAILVGIPAFLIVVLVILQLLGAVVWLPVARRVLGGIGLRPARPSVLERVRGVGRKMPFSRGPTSKPEPPPTN